MATAEKSEHAPEGDAGRSVAGSRLAGFDCLRAVAALSILTYHAVLFTPAFAGTTFWKVLLQLRSGVWVFFVVSGFLLYRPHVARELTDVWPTLRTLVTPNEFDELGATLEKDESEKLGKEGFDKMTKKVEALEKRIGINDLSQFTPKS